MFSRTENRRPVPLPGATSHRMMPEERLFKTVESHTRSEIAEALVSAAEQIEAGTVELEDASRTQRVEL